MPVSKVRIHEVTPDEAGQRLDNFLLAQLKGVPRTLVYKLVRKGQVRVNKGRVRPPYRLQAGDQVRIPPVRLPDPSTPRTSPRVGELIDAAVLLEDEHLLVVDKPSGMAVHGGSGVSAGLIENLRAMRGDQQRLELVHRLDRATSGCLLLAKKRSALRALHEQLRNNQFEKRYLLLVKGRWELGSRGVDAPLKVNQRQGGERVVTVDVDGKPARTHFRPVECYGDASLLEATLETGRTHQIRVHAAWAGHPLAGDARYGDEAFNRQCQARGLKRLFLHASALGFEHPVSGEPILVSAPLPAMLANFLDAIAGAGGAATAAAGRSRTKGPGSRGA